MSQPPLSDDSFINVIEKLLQTGVSCYKKGDYREAEEHFHSICKIEKSHPDANYFLGLLVLQKNDPAASLPYFETALDRQPEKGSYWLAYIDALDKAGKSESAREVLQLAIQSGLEGVEVDALSHRLKAPTSLVDSPNSLDQSKFGQDVPDLTTETDQLVALYQQQSFTECENHAHLLLKSDPQNGLIWKILGASLKQQDRLEEAALAMSQAVQLLPDDPQVFNNLGIVYENIGNYEGSELVLRQAITLDNTFTEAYNNLGVTLMACGKYSDSENCLRKAIDLNSKYIPAYCNLGKNLLEQQRLLDAEEVLTVALKLDNTEPLAYHYLGHVQLRLHKLDEAETSIRKSLKLRPDFPSEYRNLGSCLREQGRLDEALDAYRKSLELNPDLYESYDSLLFTLNYHQEKSGEEIFEFYRSYSNRYSYSEEEQYSTHHNEKSSNRRLKIGYVSPSFYNHSTTNFLLPLLEHHNTDLFELVGYSESVIDDSITAHYKSLFDHWVPTNSLTDTELAEQIISDKIDILIDLAGHTAGNRLKTFSLKPAPVSVHWLDFGYTTGLSTIDYYLTDCATVPIGEEHLFSENVWRLPQTALAYRPAIGMGEPGPLPASENGYITFTTLTRAIRLNNRTIDVWCKILSIIKGSQLIIDSSNFKSRAVRTRFLNKFKARGIETERIHIGYHTPPWETLRRSDITLDCFPHNSGTTLFESLYMGVPFITLAGRAAIGRIGSSILETVGHPEWIACSEDEYIEKVVALSKNISQLELIRDALRSEMLKSCLMDEPEFTKQVEAAYQAMFTKWSQENSQNTEKPNQQSTHNNEAALEQYNSGISFHQTNQIDSAQNCYLQAINLQSDFIEAYNNLGVCYQQGKNHSSAISCFSKALTLNPHYADAAFNKANSYKLQNDLINAELFYLRTIEHQGDYPGAHYNLGNILQEQGRVSESEEVLRHAIHLNPKDIGAYSMLLYCLNYHYAKDPIEIFEEYQKFNNTFFSSLRDTYPNHLNSTRKGRRLKIGYVAADYKSHPARYFLAPLLTHHDHKRFEIFSYVEVQEKNCTGDLFFPHADHWISTTEMSDEVLYERIAKDHIDILIDLAGHTAHNRLGIFARKPAPISLHYLDFGYTTGLTAIDYYLADRITIPQESEHLFSEKPWCIETPALAYRPPVSTGKVNSLPARKNGYITFGTLTRAVRINPLTIRVWSEILKNVPNSRLVVNSGSYRDPILQERLKNDFEKHGIERGRLDIGCTSPPWDVLRSLDICLDCFPHNSGTTLVESLYMGVPYITLASRPSVGTLGSSILHGINHPEWIAATEEQYIKLATDLATDLESLEEIRQHLRPQMEQSPLMDEPRFTKKVEAAFLKMFEKWVSDRSPKRKDKRNPQKPKQEQVNHLIQLFQDNKLDEGISFAKKLINDFPRDGFSWKALGTLLHRKEELSEGLWALEEAANLLPKDREVFNNLGNIQQEMEMFGNAKTSFLRALKIDPQYAEASFNLANCLEKTGAYFDAVKSYLRAIENGYSTKEVYNNLGNCYRSYGQFNESEAAYRQALANDPDYLEAHNNLLFLINNIPKKSSGEIYLQYQKFNDLFSSIRPEEKWPALESQNIKNRLNIAYISPRFCKHSTRHFLEPLLQHHDKSKVTVYAYSDLLKEDQVTNRYKSYVDHWFCTTHLSDQQLFEQIQIDKIDILVDIAGHTVGNRLPLFARKPAPISLHWLDFGYTTGLKAIDYYLTDEATVPEGSEEYFSETPWKIDTPAIVYRPARDMGQVSSPPLKQNGYVTFGTLTRAVRLNDDTIKIWSKILKAVPNGHLIINSVNFSDTEIQEHFADKFTQQGVKREQLEIGFTSPPWEVYRKIDICLDCFPHNSGTTLLESLYMGIPFVSLKGRPSVGTLGSSILAGINHPEWIATSEEEYTNIAISLATQHANLEKIRSNLRQEMEQSSLMDERGFAKKVEAAYQEMYTTCYTNNLAQQSIDSEDTETSTLIQQAFQQAQLCQEAGQLNEAEMLYQSILNLNSQHPAANFQLGLLMVLDYQQPERALPFLQKSVEVSPDNYQYNVCYIDTLEQVGQTRQAEDILNQALAIGLQGEELTFLKQRLAPKQLSTCAKEDVSRPSHSPQPPSSVISNLVTLFKSGDYSQCENVAKAVILDFPEHPFARKALGSALHLQGKVEEALDAFQEAIKTDNSDPELYNNLANVYDDQGDYTNAIDTYLQAIEIDPNYFAAYLNLGKTFQRLHNFEDSVSYLQKALKLKGDKGPLYYLLGLAFAKLNKAKEAKQAFSKSIKIAPSNADAYNELGILHREEGNFQQAEFAFKKMLQHSPKSAHGYSNLANIYWTTGQLEKSESALQKALELEPNSPDIYSNFLFLINNKPAITVEELFQNYREYNELFGIPLQKEWSSFSNSPAMDRKLRVGYVSPSFYSHSTHHFLEPLLCHHNKDIVEIFCYSDNQREDEVTGRYKTYADQWIATSSLTDPELAARIRADQIDILIDLAGHTGGNRLMVFARKPAPVSLHWLDFGYTTGLPAIDYYLTDPITTPVGSEHLFAEQPWRIEPPAFAYRPGNGMGKVSDSPAHINGYVTFATLSRAIRINEETIEVWAEILKSIKNSRLIIDSSCYRDKKLQKNIIKSFYRQGVYKKQLVVGYHSPPWDILRQTDISLDCFPHNSGTTLVESLYMGVPFITLSGRPGTGTLGSAILTSVGHPEWIATSKQDYIDLAIKLAKDKRELSRVRKSLRSEMEKSPLMDEQSFARKVEESYVEMFSQWSTTNPIETQQQLAGLELDASLEFTLQEGKIFFQTGEIEKAILAYQQILQKFPSHPETNYQYGQALLTTGQSSVAVPHFAKAANMKPEHGPYWIGYIQALELDGEIEQATQLLQSAITAGLTGHDTDILAARLLSTPPSPEVKKQKPTVPPQPQSGNLNERLIALFSTGEFAQAENLAQIMIKKAPRNGLAWKILGPTLMQQGKGKEAVSAMKKAVSLLPKDPETHYNFGIILQNNGNFKEAASAYRKTLSLKPNYRDACCNLGYVLEQLELFKEAEKSLRKAIKIDPNFALAHNNLGNILKKTGRFDEAEIHFRLAIDCKPDFVEAYSNLGNILKDIGLLKEAEKYYTKAIDLNPTLSEFHYNLANTLRLQGNIDDSITSYEKALVIKPSFSMAYNNLGVAFNEKGLFQEAKEHCLKAIEFDPENIDAYANLGGISKSLCQYKEAKEYLLRALKLKPDFATAHGNLLFLMNYHPDKSSEEIFELYKNYNRSCGIPLESTWVPHNNVPIANQRLKIGYVTAPFFRHPIRFFFEPLLSHHNSKDFEVFVYIQQYASNPIPDIYQTYADHWIPIKTLDDETLTNRIRDDKIDILIDIAGHTIGNRLGVFARKPAPVSLHWLDFGYTTGLSSIDYYLTDEAHAPKGSEHLFSEKPWIIETPCLAYRPPQGMGHVSPLPAKQHDFITFGTLTRAIRINYRTVRTWAEILTRVPNSILTIDSGSFKTPELQFEMKEEFNKIGIEPDRIKVGCHSPPWDLCRNIDIGFDCFPHNSGTTLFESLYMGIPIVTMADRPSVGRLGSSILTAIGHPEWIAHSEEEYIEIAVELAADLGKLAQHRGSLRQEMEQSGLMDEPGFTRKVETAYQQMFLKWCKEQK